MEQLVSAEQHCHERMRRLHVFSSETERLMWGERDYTRPALQAWWQKLRKLADIYHAAFAELEYDAPEIQPLSGAYREMEHAIDQLHAPKGESSDVYIDRFYAAMSAMSRANQYLGDIKTDTATHTPITLDQPDFPTPKAAERDLNQAYKETGEVFDESDLAKYAAVRDLYWQILNAGTIHLPILQRNRSLQDATDHLLGEVQRTTEELPFFNEIGGIRQRFSDLDLRHFRVIKDHVKKEELAQLQRYLGLASV